MSARCAECAECADCARLREELREANAARRELYEGLLRCNQARNELERRELETAKRTAARESLRAAGLI